MTTSPLTGIRVLDFGHTIMGPCAGMLLADLGADVVKIEPIDGDTTRHLPGFAAGFFATFNRNKRSMAVDLKRPEGQAVVHRLVQSADIVLENFGPGTIERLGCGWDTLSALNPRLIYLAMKGYLAGPYEHRTALDEVVQMQTGLAYMTGPPGQPLRAGASVIDIMGATYGIVGVLAALRERDRTGRGQRVGSALFEASAFLVGSHIAGAAATGAPMPPMPARRGAWGIYDPFAAAEGPQIFIGVTSDAHWRRFCDGFGFADLWAQARLATNPLRCEARDWLIPDLRQRFAAMPAAEILAICEAATLPYSPVNRPDDLSTDPQMLAGGLLPTMLSTLGEAGAMVGLPGLPMEFGEDRARPGLYRQPPAIGAHTEEVMLAAGWPAEEIAALRADGTIGGPLPTAQSKPS
jgi:crotonobetainyl-CoA:carnitine CoA-transferase CaiB-like acyl-CoA transferase